MMCSMTTILPGLKDITEDQKPDGGMTITFHVEDDKVDDFFNALMLERGDIKGLQRLITEALDNYIKKES